MKVHPGLEKLKILLLNIIQGGKIILKGPSPGAFIVDRREFFAINLAIEDKRTFQERSDPTWTQDQL